MAKETSRIDDSNALSGYTIVHDEHGIRYVLVTPPWKTGTASADRMKNNPFAEGENHEVLLLPLAEGAQGATYLTENPDVILKFAKSNGALVSSPEEIELFRRRVRYISSLPLPQDTNITIPETFLQDYAGYRMSFLDGMCSLYDFFFKGGSREGERPDYIPEGRAGDRLWTYLRSGSLAHRLCILGKAAVVLAKLHHGGISYGDISPNNIFLPKDKDESEVWFIDSDNLVEEGNPEWSQCIGTDPFCSPEVCEGECCTLATDVFSFAELAFYLIADHHPFHGQAYMESDLFVEEKNNPRSFAWICDPEDTSNQNELFIPQEQLLSRELMLLFWQTFVAGKNDLEARPPIALWPEFLFKELDDLTHCSECGLDFIAGKNATNCPVCHAPIGDEILFVVYPAGSDREAWKTRKPIHEKESLFHSVFMRAVVPFDLNHFEQEVLHYRIEDNRLYIQKNAMCPRNVSFYLADDPLHDVGVRNIEIPLDKVSECQLICKSEQYGVVLKRRIECQIIKYGGSK